jgi:anti-anti-sigma factor
MDIASEQSGDRTILSISGRLDGHWSDHLERQIDERLRNEQHDLVLDLSGVEFMSSAGIRVVLSSHRKLQALSGRFALRNLPEPVAQVLSLTGLLGLLSIEQTNTQTPVQKPAQAPLQASAPDPVEPRNHETATTHFELHTLGGASMRYRVQGDPGRLDGCRFTAADCQTLPMPAHSLALGLGALGNDFLESREFFGEFLALTGAIACQPGNGSTGCDYLMGEGDFIAQVQSLYSMRCEGDFSHLLRFEPRDVQQSIGLTELCEQALAAVNSPLACIAICAESAGLIGAALRRSPAVQPDPNAPYSHPSMRDWLSFSTERLDAGSTIVAVGLIARDAQVPADLQAFMRPIGAATAPTGHLHAAPFRHRPLPRGRIDLHRTVRPLFEGGSAQGVIHLLCDDRVADRPEETRFIRGACWVGALETGALA